MKNMRRFNALFLIFILTVFTLTGCKSSTDSSTTTTTTLTSSSDVIESTNTDNLSPSYDDEDFVSTWNDSSSTHITLSNSSASVSGSGASTSGSVVTITTAGTYVVFGTINEGQIVVNSTEKGTVRIILNNANITNSTTAPINVIDAKKLLITIADGTTNTITDKARSTTADEEYTAAIYTTADTVINGSGKLTITAGYKDGIASKDDLIIISGDINVTATDDGIIGKDLLNIYNGTLSIKSGGDGLKSTYNTDTTKGDILINNGTLTITSTNDAIQAQNILKIEDGIFTIKSGGGNTAAKTSSTTDFMGRSNTTTTTETESMKGLKATNYVYVNGGTFTINSQDDAVHSGNTVLISGGTFEIAAGDDGIHADSLLQFDGGTINITSSYEGFEATTITVNGGDIKMVSSDDGFNASDGSSTATGGSPMGGSPMGGSPMGGSTSSSNCLFTINGGTIYLNAGGDGLDSNGSTVMTGGTVYVDGPTDNSNASIDYDGTFKISGGLLIAAGSSGMAEAPSTATNGCVISMTFASAQSAKSIFLIKDASGNTVIEYTPAKAYSSVVVYSADIKSGSSYTVSVAGKEIVTATTSSEISKMAESGATTNNQMGGARPR